MGCVLLVQTFVPVAPLGTSKLQLVLYSDQQTSILPLEDLVVSTVNANFGACPRSGRFTALHVCLGCECKCGARARFKRAALRITTPQVGTLCPATA